MCAALCGTYVLAPGLRPHLVVEGLFLENLSAGIFLLAAFVGGVYWLARRPLSGWYLVAPIAGLFGFLEEISFGETFFQLRMPRVGDVKLDSLHDFIFLAFRQSVDRSCVAWFVVGALAAIALAALGGWWAFRRLRAASLSSDPFLLLGVAAGCVLAAQVVDLDMVELRRLYFLEELSELCAGVAILWASWLLKWVPRGVRRGDGIPQSARASAASETGAGGSFSTKRR
jgi:hypothetical protein